MNPHFKDARYYLGRTATKLVAGVKTELAPVEDAVRTRLGLEKEEVSRRERVETRLRTAGERARVTVRSAVDDGRRRLSGLRGGNDSA
ncbi:DUF7553 family protein [Haloparvum sp. PAK95]|uniref:DUF7553 family protein n=1 Tax=Haloparvum sp. PAK95 TaxID=3418962 RepID=UPI003D2F4390